MPPNAVPASQATSSVRAGSPLAGSKATSFEPVAAQTREPSWVTGQVSMLVEHFFDVAVAMDAKLLLYKVVFKERLGSTLAPR